MKKYSTCLLTGLRIIVGWHFLYEGLAKLISTDWSAKMYLMGSRWILSDFFHWMASSPEIMKVVDFLNIWGLILVGLLLFIGLFVRWSSVIGSILLLLYFIAYPPIPGYTLGAVTEGSYLWVNKTLVEFFILIVFITLPAEFFYGTDRWIKRWREEKPNVPIPETEHSSTSLSRRELLSDMISVPFLGAFVYGLYKKRKWDSFEEKLLNGQPDAISSATIKNFQFASIENLKGTLPKGKIGDLELSRLIMGGNLIGGWTHSRDLIYVSKLVKAYHTDERVMMTFQLAEECGINAYLGNPRQFGIMKKYRHETDGKIKFISDCGVGGDLIEGVKRSIDGGAAAMYCHGGISDHLVRDKKFDDIVKALELIRSSGKPAGIGGHRIETIKGCVEQGIKPDFWVKTLHNHKYWSVQVDTEQKSTVDDGYKDNIFCFKPQETIDFMNRLEEPWIAFKILAAGAIKPEMGFQYAFDNGADFVCVGMYDFQIVDDTNITLDSLANLNRSRPWRG